MGGKILQILQPFAFLALDSLSELAIACACGRFSGRTAIPGWNAPCARVYREGKGAITHCTQTFFSNYQHISHAIYHLTAKGYRKVNPYL